MERRVERAMTTKITQIKLNMGEFYQTDNFEQHKKEGQPYYNHMTMKDEEPLSWAISLSRAVRTTDSVEVVVYAHTEGEAIDIVTHHQEHDTIEELQGGEYPDREEWDDEYDEWEQTTSPRNEFSVDRDTYKDRIEAFKNIDKCREVNPHLQ